MTAPLAVAPDPLAGLAEPVRWLLQRAAPEEPALAFVSPAISLEQLYETWMQHELYGAAIRLTAGVLPNRESIWWAWVSARHATQMAGGTPPTAEVHAAINAIEQWIVRPDDDARRAAWDAGNAAGTDTPVGMVAAAVFLSGTTIAPPNIPPIPPPPGVVAPIVGGVVMLSATANSDPAQIPPTMAAFAAQGLEIVKRLGGWDAALKQSFDTHQRQMAEYQRATQPPAR